MPSSSKHLHHASCHSLFSCAYRLDDDDRELIRYFTRFAGLRQHTYFRVVLTKLIEGVDGEDELQATRRSTALNNFVKAVRVPLTQDLHLSSLTIQLSHAADAARENDTSTFGALAKGVGTTYALKVTEPTPQVIPRAVADRGFNNRTCARELCPHELLEEFDADEG